LNMTEMDELTFKSTTTWLIIHRWKISRSKLSKL
jgi:hypothetical protein